ncbi:carbohydrate kinase FGGY [Kribbella flavida DSM 17836]|uniref:Carbohydrate kinase FGGY n=1 Tax=Kribbella flavida (strain DSM 17836 / JCM 10339 / NBRC 14399) TaxID=479435 RepID=D2PT72_KRIFD|nr:rhamnulokinase family protein [Kribbella flavida]ADB29388.1 carbohydrate kinase FGGY [Kribbella flavida DSM 17836]
MSLRLAAVDLGASSGRVMVGRVGPDTLELSEVHRFSNGPVRVQGTLHWDILRLYQETLAGLGEAARTGPLDGLGIDSWAVDYGLLDAEGRLLGNPVHYRDSRTDGVMDGVLRKIPAEDLYAVTGLQQLPFNTIYQLVAERALDRATSLLLIPDLLSYWLTGVAGAEATNASTTQLYDVRFRTWSADLAGRIGVPLELLPPLREPGQVIGPVLPEVAEETGLDATTPVIAVGSHDTASSVVAVPAAAGDRFAYISSGTWSLVGLELPEPVLTPAAQEANFTNEGGVDGRTRFLKNVMGLWILQECLRVWGTDDLVQLLKGAADVPAFGVLVDPDHPSFLAPGNMPARIAEFCAQSGQEPPTSRAVIVRCVLESLALAYRRTLRRAQQVAGREVDVVHVIGGGSQNELLCQLTADACGVPVLAGPVEASALGNVLVQARALGEPLPDLDAMRALVRATHRLRRYEPQGRPADWDAAESRVFGTR